MRNPQAGPTFLNLRNSNKWDSIFKVKKLKNLSTLPRMGLKYTKKVQKCVGPKCKKQSPFRTIIWIFFFIGGG